MGWFISLKNGMNFFFFWWNLYKIFLMKNFGIQKLILGFFFWGLILRNTLKIVENITRPSKILDLRTWSVCTNEWYSCYNCSSVIICTDITRIFVSFYQIWSCLTSWICFSFAISFSIIMNLVKKKKNIFIFTWTFSGFNDMNLQWPLCMLMVSQMLYFVYIKTHLGLLLVLVF